MDLGQVLRRVGEVIRGVARLADSPAIGGVQLLPGGSMRPAQPLSEGHNSL